MPSSLVIAPGRRPAVNPIITQSRWDLLPGGHRMKAVLLMGRQVFGGHENWCALFWNQWEWTAWIKPQIDMAKSLGVNTIYLHATTGGRPFTVASGANPGYVQTDTATYLAHWKQFLDYIRAQGMFCYPCMSGDTSMEIYNPGYGYIPTTASFITECRVLLDLFVLYADIIPCIDLVDECDPAWRDLPGNGDALYRAVKAYAPLFKYTFSMVGIGGPYSPPAGFPNPGIIDFIDVHPYYSINANDFDTILRYYGLPVSLGQYGVLQSAGPTLIRDGFNRLSAAVSNNPGGRHVAGCAIYTMAPTATGADAFFNDWAIVDNADNNFKPRPAVQDIFQAMPA